MASNTLTKMQYGTLHTNLILIFVLLLLGGCNTTGQKTESLMPAPITITEGVVTPSVVRQYLASSNEVSIFYATNRKPSRPDDGRHYVTDFDQKLRLGVANIHIGNKGIPADDIYTQAISSDRKKKIPLLLEQVTQKTVVTSRPGLDAISNDTRAYLKEINAALVKSRNKDITVYVHGANNTFYRSTVQAAQFRYFTGRQSVVLAFSWPSSGSLIHYGVDVKNSAQSYEVFARLIKLLSRYTDARAINILSYSAGARVASPGLNLLAQEQDDQSPEAQGSALRLGMVYYAEPDEYQVTFFQNLANYLHLTQSTTVTVNFHDSVLAFAEAYNAKPDAGRPDPAQFSYEEKEVLIAKLDKPNFSVIDIDGSKIPGLARGEHGAWYNHPWVNTDVIAQFLFQANPAERGLVLKEIERPWGKYWVYPEDYPARIKKLLPTLEKRNILKT